MVFPAQNPAVSSIIPSENLLPPPETPTNTNAPEPREEITELFPPTSSQQDIVTKGKEQAIDGGTVQPEPGQIVDLSKSKSSDTPVPPDSSLPHKKADLFEKAFREEVDSIIHEQRS